MRRARHSRPVVGRTNTTVTTALDSKAALGLPIPVNPMTQNATISTGAGEELDLSCWDWILRRGHGDSRLMEGDNGVTNDGGYCHRYR